jgi:2-polyprenyl-3-methyl-5-hydroxy-6-metoxy-1,4-benzoquinol methylase
MCDSRESRLWGVEYQQRRILKCCGCGVRFLDPSQRPGPEHYDECYFEHKASKMLDHEKLIRVMKSDADSIKTIARISPKAADPESSILDIGAGRGSFLILCKLLGFSKLTGSDISDSNAGLLSGFGIDLKVGDITTVELAQYDIVTFHHVLEHIAEPDKFLRRIGEILRDDGVGHLLIPNEGSLNSRFKSLLSRLRLKKRAFKHLSPGHHLWFYDKRTLTRLLERYGFEIECIGTRAHEKKRGLLNQVIHRLFDMAYLNTWLEAVFTKRTRAIREE